jgi:hypothetical protein
LESMVPPSLLSFLSLPSTSHLSLSLIWTMKRQASVVLDVRPGTNLRWW